LRHQHPGLLAGGLQRSTVLSQFGTCNLRTVFCLLRVLQRARALPGQMFIALQFMPGKLNLGQISVNRGTGLLDQRTLTLQHGQRVGQLCLGRRHIGLGRLQAGLVVLRINTCQQLTGLDRLVILHQHLIDKTRDFWRDQGVVGTDKSIIGALNCAGAKDQSP